MLALSDVSDSSQNLVDHLDDLDQDDIVELARKEADAPRPCAPPPPCRDPALAVDRALSVARTLPWGPERKKLTHKLKLHKVMNVKAVAVAQRERIAVATVWNHSSLARGERLNVKNGVLKRSRDKELRAKWQHARAWTLQGALKVAFLALGRCARKPRVCGGLAVKLTQSPVQHWLTVIGFTNKSVHQVACPVGHVADAVVDGGKGLGRDAHQDWFRKYAPTPGSDLPVLVARRSETHCCWSKQGQR